MKFIFLFLLCKISLAKILLEDLIPICSIKDPNLNECVRKSANLLIPILGKGIKEYEFPPIDPLRIMKMDLGQSYGPVNMRLKLKDTVHTGLSSFNFYSVSIDTEKNKWILNATLPRYALSGRYTAKGKLLLVPIIGEGMANFTFSNMNVDFIINGTPKNEKNVSTFHLNKLRVHFKFERSNFSLDNLFGGNKQIGDITTAFIRENSNEVIQEMKGSLEDTYSAIYTSLFKIILKHVPYSEFFTNS